MVWYHPFRKHIRIQTLQSYPLTDWDSLFASCKNKVLYMRFLKLFLDENY